MTRAVQRDSGAFWSGYDLLWDVTPAAPPARRGAALDRARIVRAAIAVADREGLDALSMRRVAQELHAGTMSLYRHVPDKDALVALMIDEILGRHSSAERDAHFRAVPGWRDRMRLMAESVWDLCRAHPWYPEASMVRPPLTPNALAGLEMTLAMFDDYDLSPATKMRFIGAVHFTVLSAALSANTEERTRAHFNLSERETQMQGGPFLRRMIESGRYPRVVEFITHAEHHDEKTQVMAGVELILDGIEARLAGSATAATSAASTTSATSARPKRSPRKRTG